MSKEKYQVIAVFNEDGKRFFQIGRKIDESKPLEDGNVEWKLDKKTGKPIRTDDEDIVRKLCK